MGRSGRSFVALVALVLAQRLLSRGTAHFRIHAAVCAVAVRS